MTYRWLCTSSIVIALLAALIPASAPAQQSTTSSSNQPVASFQLPVLTVTAQKEPADAQTLPVSLTAVSEAILRNAGAQIVTEASGTLEDGTPVTVLLWARDGAISGLEVFDYDGGTWFPLPSPAQLHPASEKNRTVVAS